MHARARAHALVVAAVRDDLGSAGADLLGALLDALREARRLHHALETLCAARQRVDGGAVDDSAALLVVLRAVPGLALGHKLHGQQLLTAALDDNKIPILRDTIRVYRVTLESVFGIGDHRGTMHLEMLYM